MKILSIDAWGNKKGGYEWDNWFTVGSITKEEFETLNDNPSIAKWFCTNGYTTSHDLRRLTIEDDQYNVVIREKKTGTLLFAIEYGSEY